MNRLGFFQKRTLRPTDLFRSTASGQTASGDVCTMALFVDAATAYAFVFDWGSGIACALSSRTGGNPGLSTD